MTQLQNQMIDVHCVNGKRTRHVKMGVFLVSLAGINGLYNHKCHTLIPVASLHVGRGVLGPGWVGVPFSLILNHTNSRSPHQFSITHNLLSDSHSHSHFSVHNVFLFCTPHCPCCSSDPFCHNVKETNLNCVSADPWCSWELSQWWAVLLELT